MFSKGNKPVPQCSDQNSDKVTSEEVIAQKNSFDMPEVGPTSIEAKTNLSKTGLNVNSKPWTGAKKWTSIYKTAEHFGEHSVPVPKSVPTHLPKMEKGFGKKKNRNKVAPASNPVRPNRFTSKYFETKPEYQVNPNTTSEAIGSEDSESDSEEFPFIQREVDVKCPFCTPGQEVHFKDPTQLPSHLKVSHQLTIRNLYHMTSCLQPYLDFWAGRLRKLNSFSTETKNWGSLLPKTTVDQETLYEINPDSLEEDMKIRHELQQTKLKEILSIQEQERNGVALLPRACLFCRVEAENRTSLFRHMFSEHGFNIGLPDNLVNVEEFLTKLEDKLNEDRCLYCDKVFKDALVLRKHMRKKKHFKVHPCNHTYDRFYVINYAEPGKNWQALEKEKEEDKPRVAQDAASASDASWDAWEEEEFDSTKSLFDDSLFDSPEAALDYDNKTYGFDFEKLCISLDLNFYQSVVLVNYIRYQTAIRKCVGCGSYIPSDLSAHFKTQACLNSWNLNLDAAFWSDPRYLMPTIENDPLLMFLDPGEDSEVEPLAESEVRTEPQKVPVDKLSSQLDNISIKENN